MARKNLYECTRDAITTLTNSATSGERVEFVNEEAYPTAADRLKRKPGAQNQVAAGAIAKVGTLIKEACTAVNQEAGLEEVAKMTFQISQMLNLLLYSAVTFKPEETPRIEVLSNEVNPLT